VLGALLGYRQELAPLLEGSDDPAAALRGFAVRACAMDEDDMPMSALDEAAMGFTDDLLDTLPGREVSMEAALERVDWRAVAAAWR
jgi:hypothetical protein